MVPCKEVGDPAIQDQLDRIYVLPSGAHHLACKGVGYLLNLSMLARETGCGRFFNEVDKSLLDSG
jgi:hypothetical protein